jgi:TetR/AcrR family transcriptional regulator
MSSTRFSERASAGPVARPAGAPRPGVRQQILEAALAEFAEKGFQEASLAAIARRLGVTAPLVLYHFGSKANLWREALEVFCSNLAVVVQRAAEDGNGMEGREALRLMVRRLVHFFATNRAAYRLMRDEGGVENGQSDWFTSKNLRPIIGQIEAVYDRAVAEGAVRPAPFETTFFMILGAVSCYLESRTLVSRLFGADSGREAGRAADTGAERAANIGEERVANIGEERAANWIDDYANQVVGLCFDGLSVRTTRAERPMLAALRQPSRNAVPSTTANLDAASAAASKEAASAAANKEAAIA